MVFVRKAHKYNWVDVAAKPGLEFERLDDQDRKKHFSMIYNAYCEEARRNSANFELFVKGYHNLNGKRLVSDVREKYPLLMPLVIKPRFAGPYALNLKTGKSNSALEDTLERLMTSALQGNVDLAKRIIWFNSFAFATRSNRVEFSSPHPSPYEYEIVRCFTAFPVVLQEPIDTKKARVLIFDLARRLQPALEGDKLPYLRFLGRYLMELGKGDDRTIHDHCGRVIDNAIAQRRAFAAAAQRERDERDDYDPLFDSD